MHFPCHSLLVAFDGQGKDCAQTNEDRQSFGQRNTSELFFDEDEGEKVHAEAEKGTGFVSPLTLHPSRGRKHAASFLFIGHIPLRGQRGKTGQCK